MKRRALLKGAAAVAMGAVPRWIRTAYAGDTCDRAVSPARGLIALSEGYRTAQRAGRPLLVLVIPAKTEDRWLPGHAFGELFNHGSEDQLLPFAMVDVVCAKMSALRRLVPTAPAGEPLMVLVDTDRSPATARALDAKLEEDTRFGGELKWDDYQKAVDKLIDARIAKLAGLVHDALVEEPALSRYVAQNRAALTPAEQAQLATGELNELLLDRAGPMLVARVLGGKGDDVKEPLVRHVTRRVREKPPLGAKWALSGGCGVELEEPEPADTRIAYACGMGHTPKRSRRFLYFFKHRYGEEEKDDD